MNKDENLISKTFTFLSRNIKKLYDTLTESSELFADAKRSEDVNSVEELLHKWDLSSLNVDSISAVYLSEKWFFECLRKFLPILNDLTSLLTPNDLKVFSLEWTGMQTVLYEAVDRITEPHVAHHYSALLQISAVTERILGSVYLLRGKTVPFLLRDLLDTDELKELLDKELVDFLKIFIGSVHGLNVRNIAWHGFLGVQDIHQEHSVVLLFALHKCGEHLHKRKLEIGSLSPLDLEKAFSSLDKNMKKFEFEEGDPIEIIANSTLVYSVMFPLWEEAVFLMARRRKDALLLLLPLIENALRILYTTVNACPSRILTATNSAFYVTMDEIFSPWMTSPNRTTNKGELETVDSENIVLSQKLNLVPQYLGRQLTEAFYDVFHYVSGPRLRDRTSHGEILPDEVPFEVIRHLFRLCLLVLSAERWRFSEEYSRFTMKCECESFAGKTYNSKCSFHYSNETENFLKKNYSSSLHLSHSNSYLVSYIDSYESTFHPSSLLKQSLLKSLSDLERWRLWEHPSQDDPIFSWNDHQVLSFNVNTRWKFIFGDYTVKSLNEIGDVTSLILPTSFFTLSFSKLELEIVRSLQRIVNSIEKSLDNVCLSLTRKYSLYISKNLRSRQRESYMKQLNNIPDIVSHVFFTLQMLFVVFSSCDRWKYVDPSLSSPLKALLKKVLKASENLITFTDPSVNKYYEALETLKENTMKINNYFKD